MILFLLAGYEDLAAVLTWFIHLMSKNPRVQAKIKAELGDNKHQRLSIEQLDSLEYLNCVLQEVLRFGPPVSFTVRNVTADDRLPACGAQLYKGDEVMINIYSLTRDKRYWKIDPDLFYPERFQGEDKDHHPYASIPFGGGHRQCIGQDLARLALKAIAARLMQHVTFGDGGPEVNAGGHSWRITLTPKNVGVTITVD
jgi:cytochrome P450